MNSFALLLTPLAVLLPVAAVDLPGGSVLKDDVVRSSPEEAAPAPISEAPYQPLQFLEEARRPVANQVRIEQRVIIRIAPSTPQNFERSLAELNRQADSFEEVRLNGCIPINMIAAVYPRENRLLLIMRDRRVLSAALERSCSPQDFYSGFYIERQDGQLCAKRDHLQSRAGASCQVSRLNRLVASRD